MEQEKNNKGVIALLVAIIVILAALCALFATGTISLKSNNSNNNTSESNKINDTANDTRNDENQQINNNSDDTNENTIDSDKIDNTKPLDGEIADSTIDVASWTKEYSMATSYEVSKEFCGPPIPTAAFIFVIKDGVLSLTNKDTGQSATLEGITNFKNMTYVQLYTSCYSYSIYLSTEDGKVYQSIIPLNEINDVSNLNNIFRLINLPIKVKEIGVIKTKDVPATAEEVLLKDDNDIEYYGAGSKYYKIS